MNSQNTQSGVSLMLAVLVLAAITAIAFSLTTIIFIELRSSGDVLRGEPALYATLGVTEEALFQYKRYVNGPDPSDPGATILLDVETCYPAPSKDYGDTNICDLGGVTLEPDLLTEDDVPKLITVYAGETVKIPLYQANTFDQQYSKIEFDLVPNSNKESLGVSILGTEIDGDTTSWVNQVAVSDPVLSFEGFLDNTQYDLELTNGTSENFLVSIVTYDANSPSDYKGLPFIGKRAMDVVANYLGINRTYRVYIPVP